MSSHSSHMSSFPAGLSTESLDTNIASASAPPPMQDDQWSDAHDTVETDDERDAIEEVHQHPEDLTIRGPKLASPDKPLEISTNSPTTVTPRNSTEQEQDFGADATSVRSMPVVQVTEPTSPVMPMTAYSASSSFPEGPSTNLAPPSPTSHHDRDRRRRHRNTLDTRAANRFSGFLSSLIHRRDQPPPSPGGFDDKTSPPNASSRGSTPPPTRVATPPPPLPPPSLRDLGLTLSSLTTHLSPSHFSTPPTSGAFLSPHYLLLCHAQGLDVLPLRAPPATQPYALIRRVSFKSVVVMEHRGVLVAIAGRRDGVRVYALEEVKRAVEWRIDVELRRERDRQRREEAKRGPPVVVTGMLDETLNRNSSEKQVRTKSSATTVGSKGKQRRKSSVSSVPPLPIPTPSLPRSMQAQSEPALLTSPPLEPPPAYNASYSSPPSPHPRREPSLLPIVPSRSRRSSVNNVLAGTLVRRPTSVDDHIAGMDPDAKGDWGSSDDEAINVVASTAGSQALDERTSLAVPTPGPSPRIEMPRSQTSPVGHGGRRRPTNLDLALTRAHSTNPIVVPPTSNVIQPPPSPTPTLITLRQALSSPPPGQVPTLGTVGGDDGDGDGDGDGEEEEDGDLPHSSPTRERISLAEALLESRLPELPPAGSRRAQDAILIGSDDVQASPRSSESHTTQTRPSISGASARRRRRWSVLDGIFQGQGLSQSSIPSLPEIPSDLNRGGLADLPEMRERVPSMLTRSSSTTAMQSAAPLLSRPPNNTRPSTSPGPSAGQPGMIAPHELLPSSAVPAAHSSRFARIISNAFSSRRSDDPPALNRSLTTDSRKISISAPPPAPAPKLEYVKLPGTKGAVMVKAVETAKKSFLAILCGENGEKVELFAGTYRTALGLSRTFILPDSPRSLELQLQGDDLVEVFLVFGQNVFGLEPATVRVREVRIGRAERRAARRRARENNRIDQQASEAEQGEQDVAGADDDTVVSVNITASAAPSTPALTFDEDSGSRRPSPSPIQRTDSVPVTTEGSSLNGATASTDELLSLAAAQMSPYTTFQQLPFAPNFPLATIADDYVIPPTYPSFLEYRSTYEPEVNGTPNVDLSQVQFSPPGLPVPTPGPPSKWLYRDPKGIVHGPWKASLMQVWYKDGLLPPDLPVRREEDSDFVLLKDLRLQSVDPTHPFRSSPPPPSPSQVSLVPDSSKPLLSPISLLSQPKHFGPPALFYSSRGGHSTTIVDARGRSVLKGRFLWSADDTDESYSPYTGRLGDVRRLEAFDIQNRAILVAMRQGGLEAVDFGDALLRPADYSRTLFPHFQPPLSTINRRGPFVWKIGHPLSSHGSSSSSTANASLSKDPPKSIVTRKKQSTGPAKSPGRTDFSSAGDLDPEHMQDEVLFLGRKDDEMYLCERRIGSFRILRLSPSTVSS